MVISRLFALSSAGSRGVELGKIEVPLAEIAITPEVAPTLLIRENEKEIGRTHERQKSKGWGGTPSGRARRNPVIRDGAIVHGRRIGLVRISGLAVATTVASGSVLSDDFDARVLHVTRAGFLRWQSDHGGEAVPILIRPITDRKLDFAGVGSGRGQRSDRHRPTAKCSGHRNHRKNRPPTSPSSRIRPSVSGSCPRRLLSMSPDSGNVKRTPRQARS